jgi:hypothetical protein
MSLDSFTVARQAQRNGGTDPLELNIEDYFGEVLHTLTRKSKFMNLSPFKPVTGTSILRIEAIGSTSLQKIVPGVTPNGTNVEFGKTNLVVDTPLLARVALPMIDVFQSSYDKRVEIGREHGETIAKFVDQTLAIANLKAALSTTSAFYNNSNELDGHNGATQFTMDAAGDVNDPAKLDAAMNSFLAKLEEERDIEGIEDGGVFFVRPQLFYRLLRSERLISTEYITAEGNSIKTMALASHGIPVMKSRNLPAGSTISSHLLSNTGNGNFFDGDFTKVVALFTAPGAIEAGQTIPFTPRVFWDEVSKSWYVDCHGAFSAAKKRVEKAGAILIP